MPDATPTTAISRATPTESPASAGDASLLFRPFEAGALKLPNRIVMAPMTRNFSPGGVPGQDVATYYARRAAGGTGLIITEGTYVGHASAGEHGDVPLFHGEAPLAGWRRVVEDVHAAGGRIAPQLWHVGTVRKAGQPPVAEAPSVGPSGLTPKGIPTGDERSILDLAGIDAVIGAFAAAAADAERIGFDGVELHGAHGYLIDQFLWSKTNRRTDEYGGDPVARTRFAADVVKAVREAVSPSLPVILRMSQWKIDNYDARLAATPQELERILVPLAEAGVDVFHASTRRYWLPEFEGSDLNLAGWVKKITGRPVITVGSVGLDSGFVSTYLSGKTPSPTGITPLLERLTREEFDLVAIGRSLLGDPEWPTKTRDGRAEDIMPFSLEAMATLT
ncbi:NADH:flavin oxidoreductase [Streptomyces sp. NBC_01520]|uniref:NADH:flavin oxidoreductase n=1 Tax=Streptomyces sp. NBC_01520 TaxID=2903892 RepID=UPI0038689226